MFSIKFSRGVFSVLLFVTALFITTTAIAQTRPPAPRPTATPRDATRPPGQEQNPALPPGTQPQTTNPTAPPGTQRTSPTTPPATNSATPPVSNPTTSPTTNPATPAQTPTSSPSPVTADQEPREPVIPQFQPQPMPPLPDMSRLGVSNTTLPLSLNDAIKRALENNNDIEIARDDVRFAETQLRALEGIFDPVFSITPQIDKRVIPVQNIFAGGGTTGSLSSTVLDLSPAVTKQFGRGGGNYQVQFSNSRTKTTATNSTLNPFFSSNLSLSATQPLWRNRSIDNNRRQIRIQRKRIQQSDADFRLRTIDTITRVQQAYWELVFALRDQQNQLENLNLTRENLRNVDAQIAAGAKAPLERAEVQTELASRETALLTAVQNVSIAENNLKQLIFRERSAADWNAQVTPTDSPSFNEAPVNLADAIKDAQENRPELRRLRLEAEVNQIDLTYFKNQTKPRFDLQAIVATTGLAGTPAANLPQGISPNPTLVGGYGQTLQNLFSINTYNVTVGVAIEIPFKNKTAQANLAGANIQREQLLASMRSTEQTVEVDVRNAAQAVDSSRRRVLSAKQARINAELQLEGEQRLYQVGRSTTFLLFQRQNALTNARASELRAQTDYNKAIADLQRATATTLRANNVIVETPSVP
ncbi:MAG TPA: TolC family protein [Pyrinomonadaceae bacterium]